jgi:hypothetical protein
MRIAPTIDPRRDAERANQGPGPWRNLRDVKMAEIRDLATEVMSPMRDGRRPILGSALPSAVRQAGAIGALLYSLRTNPAWFSAGAFDLIVVAFFSVVSFWLVVELDRWRRARERLGVRAGRTPLLRR